MAAFPGHRIARFRGDDIAVVMRNVHAHFRRAPLSIPRESEAHVNQKMSAV